MPPPNPGSPEAVAAGCSCPVLDNDHGRGPSPTRWSVAAGCPVHDPADEAPSGKPAHQRPDRSATTGTASERHRR